jgi:hypothetical protein
LLPPP